jgi:hypothetical protein
VTAGAPGCPGRSWPAARRPGWNPALPEARPAASWPTPAPPSHPATAVPVQQLICRRHRRRQPAPVARPPLSAGRPAAEPAPSAGSTARSRAPPRRQACIPAGRRNASGTTGGGGTSAAGSLHRPESGWWSPLARSRSSGSPRSRSSGIATAAARSPVPGYCNTTDGRHRGEPVASRGVGRVRRDVRGNGPGAISAPRPGPTHRTPIMLCQCCPLARIDRFLTGGPISQAS